VGVTRTLFKQSFGHAPARLELLGSHAEWNDGLLMAVAIDRHLCLASRRARTAASSWFPQRIRSAKHSGSPTWPPTTDAPWTGVAKALLRNFRSAQNLA
jgi:galactokinase